MSDNAHTGRRRGPEGALEPLNTHFERPIFVLGLPRSGTSLVAGLLGRCGVWTGTTVPGGPENRHGFYEHELLREKVVKQILSRAGFDPLGSEPLPPPGIVFQVPGLVEFIR